jgi:hypothetical protein
MNELQEREQRITELTDEWMSTIGAEHHKDRDCHFYIERVWSYGEKPYWRMTHHGYWNDRVCQKCETYRDALELLEHFVKSAIADAKKALQEEAE